jgi:hypothetical protein
MGNIDEQALRSKVRFLLTTRIHGISSGGSTGEGAMIEDADLRRCLEIIGEENAAKLPGRQGGFPRKPALPVTEPLLYEMRAALQNAGLLAA